ncbi:phage polarity suppression protein, partial [Salmonella enterica subsp. enterica serovar Infantis]
TPAHNMIYTRRRAGLVSQ